MNFVPAFGLVPLSIKDKPLIDSILFRQKTMLSAYSFASHYIWRHHFNFFWDIVNGYLCLFAQYGDCVYMPIPPLPSHPELVSGSPSNETMKQVRGNVSDLFNLMNKRNSSKTVSRIENIDETWIESFTSAGYKIKPGESEYVYLREDLSALKGDPYKSKRAMCNHFEKHYKYSYVPFETEHAAQCLDLYKSWSQTRADKTNDSYYKALMEDSFSAHKEVIKNYKELKLTGRVVIIEKKIEGYIFGFERGRDIYYILLEVANPGVKGLAQFMFREFCKELDGYTYINALGDSGLENLRNVKLSYRPVKIVPSFIIYRD